MMQYKDKLDKHSKIFKTFFDLPHDFWTQKVYKNHEVSQKNSLLH